MENTNSLLNEKYRPTELKDYVGNGSLKSTIAAQLYNNDIQNYLGQDLGIYQKLPIFNFNA